MAGLALLVVASGSASAQQRRDFMIALQPNGTDLYLDAVFPGLQATVEHRVPVYGAANGFTARANTLWTLLFMEQQLDLELRILVLTLGTSVGWVDNYRNYDFGPDDRVDQVGRRERDARADWSSERWAFWEGRATLSLPINDYVVFNGINTLRVSGRPERSFDWRNGVVRDDGFLFRSDLALFLKHPDWGGIAPLVQIQRYGLDGRRRTQINYGFMAVTRPGFRHKNDILLFQLLWNFGDRFGGIDARKTYGQHTFHGPFTFILAYRMVFPLYRSDGPGDED